MKTTRLKQSAPAIKTREEMEALVGEIAALTLEQRELRAEMDGRIMDVRAEYEAQLVGIDELCKAKLALAQDWAEAHPEEFGKRKSIEMVHGLVGWRTGTPKLRTLAGWTWDKVREALRAVAPAYIRTVEEVNREAIIANRETLGAAALKAIGVRVVQDESFFVVPKQEERTPAPAATSGAS